MYKGQGKPKGDGLTIWKVVSETQEAEGWQNVLGEVWAQPRLLHH